jgi:LmbE family N-acetylglucosaminyl deacetylase
MESRSILVVAAHPDDEVLGCGGTISKLADEGATIHVAFMADGVFAREGKLQEQEQELKVRRAAAHNACSILGVQSVSFDEFPDNRMDTVPLLEIARSVEHQIAIRQPLIVFTHHSGDLNIDHRRVHEAVVTACRPQRDHSVRTVLCFEVPSSTEWQLPGSAPPFLPNWFEDISETLGRKIAAIEAYSTELKTWPHPRSIEAITHLARWRGAIVGVEAAEAFVLGRHRE